MLVKVRKENWSLSLQTHTVNKRQDIKVAPKCSVSRDDVVSATPAEKVYTIVSTWTKCLDELNIFHQVEPRNRYTDSENRPDKTTYDSTGHLTKDLDISLAHPNSCDTVQSAAKISGYAAELREKRKMTKYGQQQSIE